MEVEHILFALSQPGRNVECDTMEGNITSALRRLDKMARAPLVYLIASLMGKHASDRVFPGIGDSRLKVL